MSRFSCSVVLHVYMISSNVFPLNVCMDSCEGCHCTHFLVFISMKYFARVHRSGGETDGDR